MTKDLAILINKDALTSDQIIKCIDELKFKKEIKLINFF